MVDATGYEFTHMIISVSIGVSVVVANVILIVLLYQNRSEATSSSVLLVSLSLASLLIGIITPLQPGYFVGKYSVIPHDENSCHSLKWMDIVLLSATGAKIFSLTAITAERYRSSTNHKFNKRESSTTLAVVVVLAIWIMSFAYNSVVYAQLGLGILYVSLENPKQNHVTHQIQIPLPNRTYSTSESVTGGVSRQQFIIFCFYKSESEGQLLVVLHSMSVVLFYVGPCVCILVMFGRMFCLLSGLSQKVNTDSLSRARVCTTKAMSAIVALFLVVWIPGHIFQIEILHVDRELIREKKLSNINFKWRVLHDMAIGIVCCESFVYVIVYLMFVHNFLGRTVENVRSNLKRRFSVWRCYLARHERPRRSDDVSSGKRFQSIE